MQILVSKNGQQHGPFGLDELRQLVLQGTFTVNDSACFDGHNWSIVSEVPGFVAGSRHAEPSPQATSSSHMGQQHPRVIHPEPSAGMRMLLPVGRSWYAIAAGYLGLFSVLLVFAPLALLFGILGVRDIKNNKDKHGMGRAVFGIIMGAICSIVLVWWIFFEIAS